MMIWFDMIYEVNAITYNQNRRKGPTLSMEKAYKRIPPQNLPTNPVLMPILGRVVLDSLRRRSPLDLLLQNKLKHPMMLSLGLSFSPFPAGDLVSRESQKTREFGVKEEHF